MKFYTCGEQIWVLQNILKHIQQNVPYLPWSETEKAKISLKIMLMVGCHLNYDINTAINLSLLLFTVLTENCFKFSGCCWSSWLFQWQVHGKPEILWEKSEGISHSTPECIPQHWQKFPAAQSSSLHSCVTQPEPANMAQSENPPTFRRVKVQT